MTSAIFEHSSSATKELAMAEQATRTDLSTHLAEGRTYLWALRHSHERAQTPERQQEIRELFAKVGVNGSTLAALRELEHPIARYPHASVARPTHDEYLRFEIADFHVYLNGALCERGLQAGIELFPVNVDWSFCHTEVQYCTGGDTPIEATLPSNRRETKRIRPGDVMVIPKGAHLVYQSSRDDNRYEHAHIFAINVGGMTGEVFYDVFDLTRLQTMGLIAPDDSPVPFHDIAERIKIKTWSELLHVDPSRESDRPTWLRNGWSRREESRLLNYHEGTDSLVIAAPDRGQGDYLPWGEGQKRCYVNPIVAEANSAICDTHFPAGYRCMLPDSEIWTVLRGKASVTQSTPPLHGETIRHDVAMGDLMVAAGGANISIDDAESDFVVRRLAETCAHNRHAQMMELKLLDQGDAH